jgi:hypothetical protein
VLYLADWFTENTKPNILVTHNARAGTHDMSSSWPKWNLEITNQNVNLAEGFSLEDQARVELEVPSKDTTFKEEIGEGGGGEGTAMCKSHCLWTACTGDLDMTHVYLCVL